MAEKPQLKIIKGGKDGNEDSCNQARLEKIADGIANQDDLTQEEALELAKTIKEQRRQDIKAAVLKFCGRILDQEDLDFIGNRILSLSSGEQKTIDELNEKFPDLKQFFENNLRNL